MTHETGHQGQVHVTVGHLLISYSHLGRRAHKGNRVPSLAVGTRVAALLARCRVGPATRERWAGGSLIRWLPCHVGPVAHKFFPALERLVAIGCGPVRVAAGSYQQWESEVGG